MNRFLFPLCFRKESVVLQVDTADARVIICSDIQVPDDHVDTRECHVQLLG